MPIDDTWHSLINGRIYNFYKEKRLNDPIDHRSKVGSVIDEIETWRREEERRGEEREPSAISCLASFWSWHGWGLMAKERIKCRVGLEKCIKGNLSRGKHESGARETRLEDGEKNKTKNWCRKQVTLLLFLIVLLGWSGHWLWLQRSYTHSHTWRGDF